MCVILRFQSLVEETTKFLGIGCLSPFSVRRHRSAVYTYPGMP
jgi:hypothetical protein